MHFYKECFIPIIFGHYECFYEALFLTKKFNKKAFVWQEFFYFFFHKSSSHNHQKNCLLSLQHISKHTVTLLDAKLILNYYIDIAPKRCISLQNVLRTCTFYVHCIQHYKFNKKVADMTQIGLQADEKTPLERKKKNLPNNCRWIVVIFKSFLPTSRPLFNTT